jgi:GT2 family glycosyltransferase
MKTGIVILNYGNFQDTINCIKSVQKFCIGQDLKIIVVDNGSTNDSVIQIANFFREEQFNYRILDVNHTKSFVNANIPFLIIPTNRNLGYAKGNNVGIRFLTDQMVDNILILNNDILFTCNVIPPLINALDSNPEIGIISPLLMGDKNLDYNCCRKNPTTKILITESLKYLPIPGFKKIIDQKYLLKSKPELIEQDLVFCDIVSGSCIMAKRSTWENIRFFDEATFLYYEENILFEKLQKLNKVMALLPNVKAIHLGARATRHVININILQIELESLLYYLRNYKHSNFIVIFVVKFFRLTQIILLKSYNKFKKIRNINK